jgi:hypothetical protein
MTRSKPSVSELCVVSSSELANVTGGLSDEQNWPKKVVDWWKKEDDNRKAWDKKVSGDIIKNHKKFTEDNKNKTKALPNWGRKR